MAKTTQSWENMHLAEGVSDKCYIHAYNCSRSYTAFLNFIRNKILGEIDEWNLHLGKNSDIQMRVKNKKPLEQMWIPATRNKNCHAASHRETVYQNQRMIAT